MRLEGILDPCGQLADRIRAEEVAVQIDVWRRWIPPLPLDGILIGAGDLRFLAVAMVTATAVLVPWAFSVLWLDLGIGWLWGALCAWMTVRAATLLWRYRTDAWAITGATRA